MSAPKVLIDARMIGPVGHGIARYVTRLASGLAAMGTLPYEPVFLVARETPRGIFSRFETIEAKSPFLSRSELREIPRILRENGISLYHSPSFSSLALWGGLKPVCPWIVTIHDLNHLRYGSFGQKLYYRFLLKAFARHAAALATVSEFSRNEIAGWLGLPREKVEIVPNALEAEPAPTEAETRDVLAKYELESRKFFFCLSNPKPHKNVPFLVRAYSEYRKEFGVGDPWPLAISMSEHGNAVGVRPLGSLNETEVRVLRAHAAAVFFPSLYEGFGLPPVEAAIAGTPLVVSRIPPHEEGLADLATEEAVWIGPTDKEGWKEGFRMIRSGQVAPPAPATRDKILHRFGEAQLAGHMDRIYRRVLGKKL